MLDLTMPELIARIVVLMVAFSVHEFAHAWTADYFGDNTPRSQGRLTLNPMAHLDPIGSLMLLLAGFGWARPVMVDIYAIQRRSPAGYMWVALAGPVSNFLMAAAAGLLIKFGLVTYSVQTSTIFPTPFLLVIVFVHLNLVLMLFNLIPIFPLDGEKILTHFLPPSGRQFMDQIRPYGPMLLMVLIFLVPGSLGTLIGGPLDFLFNLLI
ncbi:MAG: site-2 protease family protein [Anaerolineae bacterium]|nr:site-2 protease family protein [Anaerolineae bacterium]